MTPEQVSIILNTNNPVLMNFDNAWHHLVINSDVDVIVWYFSEGLFYPVLKMVIFTHSNQIMTMVIKRRSSKYKKQRNLIAKHKSLSRRF